MKIFIADSSRLIRERLISVISIHDNIELVGSSENPEAMVEDVAGKKPDLLIMDCRLPEQHSCELIKKIRQENEALILIVFTKYPYPQYRKQCLEAGADFFFNKATDFRELIDTITSSNIQKLAAASRLNGESVPNLSSNGGK